ncbi:hypothetical protein ACQKOF_05040 [Lysinibacillus sp. NPDC093190]|uniref:hypothetical protein n=1 Tax=Lysinibacillus sp. NPDC093190 TaxID=3390575 RepID=UPI003D08BECC
MIGIEKPKLVKNYQHTGVKKLQWKSEAMENMNVDEKWKLLEILYEKYFNKDHIVVDDEAEEE